jgi:hypothetical protein
MMCVAAGREPGGDAGGDSLVGVSVRAWRGTMVVAWIAVFIGGAAALSGYACYLARGPRKPRLTAEQLSEMQVLAQIERDEDLI